MDCEACVSTRNSESNRLGRRRGRKVERILHALSSPFGDGGSSVLDRPNGPTGQRSEEQDANDGDTHHPSAKPSDAVTEKATQQPPI
jgi:hypothetical protein